MKPVDILRKARKLIEKPEQWTQKAFARTADGAPCDEHATVAVSFCVVGALRRAIGQQHQYGEQWDKYIAAREFVHAAVMVGQFSEWNDKPSRTHPEVLAAFDKAIALAEAEQ